MYFFHSLSLFVGLLVGFLTYMNALYDMDVNDDDDAAAAVASAFEG